MSRKKIYLCIGIFLLAAAAGIAFYRIYIKDEAGHVGDEIVYFGNSSGETDTDFVRAEEQTPAAESASPSMTAGAADSPTPAVSPTASPAEEEKEAYPKITSNGKLKQYPSTGTAVIDGAGFEIYNYVEQHASRYTKVINKFTKKLDAAVSVYDMVIPTSVDITFPDNKRKKLSSTPQEDALKKIEKKLSGREKFIPLYDTMMRHRNEYIYFRTDHHWTQLGAYYAYSAFCGEKGIVPNPLSSYTKKISKGFMGSFYVDAFKDKTLKKDDVEMYHPLGKNIKMQYRNTGKKLSEGAVISDPTNYGLSGKYLAFIGGDNAYTLITNKDKHDGSRCIVVKESFGNAFVPFLADHYEKVYVIDYRYWDGKLVDFVRKTRAKEVLLVNNISMTRNAYLIGMLSKIL